MLQHVYERAVASGAEEVLIATDDTRIADVAQDFGATVCMTAVAHPSGTDRLAEVAQQRLWQDQTIIVNVQGDEPLIPPANIAQVARNIARHNVNMATLCTSVLDRAELRNPNVVKVVMDQQGMALYFSRAVIPFQRDDFFEPVVESVTDPIAAPVEYYRHIGLYAYTVQFLTRFAAHGSVAIERAEKLEQLRALWIGERIHIEIAAEPPAAGVDTPDDLARLQQYFTNG